MPQIESGHEQEKIEQASGTKKKQLGEDGSKGWPEVPQSEKNIYIF